MNYFKNRKIKEMIWWPPNNNISNPHAFCTNPPQKRNDLAVAKFLITFP
jgi:hypothetical protein